MLIKSSGTIAAATAIVLLAAGGSAVAVSIATSGFGGPSGPPGATAQPQPAGAPATARLPGAPVTAPGPGGQSPSTAPGQPSSSPTHPAAGPTQSLGPGQQPVVKIRGASAAVLAMGSARASIAALAHSPQLLSDLANPIVRGGRGGTTTTVNVPGIDVAAFQHPNGAPINWADVAAAGYKFAAVKGTEGDYYVNPWVSSDVAVAKEVGMDVTAYHFAIPNVSSGAEQAQFAVEYSGYASGPQMLPLMLDIEYDPYVSTDGTNMCYGLTPAQMVSWTSAFVTTARSLTGQYPIIYTTANWWDTCTGGSTAFGSDPMWVAAYGFSSPPMPDGWPAYTYWQYTSSGTVPGVDTPDGTDLSDFNTGLAGLIDPGSQKNGVGAKVSLQVSSLAAVARQPLDFTATGLPPGLAINGLGMISGVITGKVGGADPTYHVTISATNDGSPAGSVSFTWQINMAAQVIATSPP